jgi:hypothetical protein
MKPWLRVCTSFEEEAEADREYWQQFSPGERVALIEQMRHEWAAMTDEPKPNRDQMDFVKLLTKHGVRALIVGAHALGFHARPRYTKDLDIFVEASPENAGRVVDAIGEFGFANLGITADDLAERGRVIQLGFPPNRIDVMTNISGVTFAEAWEHRVEGTLGDQPVFFIGKADLMRNKSAAGRHQDLADLELLRRF